MASQNPITSYFSSGQLSTKATEFLRQKNQPIFQEQEPIPYAVETQSTSNCKKCKCQKIKKLEETVRKHREETQKWRKMYISTLKIANQKDIQIYNLEHKIHKPASEHSEPLSLQDEEFKLYFSDEQLKLFECFPAEKSDYSFIYKILSILFKGSENIPTLSGRNNDYILDPVICDTIVKMTVKRIHIVAIQADFGFRSDKKKIKLHIANSLSNLKAIQK